MGIHLSGAIIVTFIMSPRPTEHCSVSSLIMLYLHSYKWLFKTISIQKTSVTPPDLINTLSPAQRSPAIAE